LKDEATSTLKEARENCRFSKAQYHINKAYSQPSPLAHHLLDFA
jgi:hypothetical protein